MVAESDSSTTWKPVASGVLQSAGTPCGYALIDAGAALLIAAPRRADPGSLAKYGVDRVERVLLTHHHRDSAQRTAEFIAAGTSVQAPAASADWLTVEGVAQFWQAAAPRPAVDRDPPLKERTFNDWVYLVHPTGFPGVDCCLIDGQHIQWRSWTIECLATPGHSRDHMAFLASRNDGSSERRVLFCGDALASAGKMPTPYTTDWDHWSGKGLHAAFESLRRLATTHPLLICPEHGPPIGGADAALAIYQTAMNVADAEFLKSFERFTKERLGNPPAYAFLARSQVVTAGDEPWTQLSPHLFLTGNTFVLTSRDGGLLVFDAYGPRIVEQIARLRDEFALGAIEAVTISHAHNDHYQGVFLLQDRERFAVWTQAGVAAPLRHPYLYCAPYLDARPLRVDQTPADGETIQWHEHALTFHHLPGQTEFAMGVEATIDGRRCVFTGDNFYHSDQFGGSGGWSGRNRGLPLPYAESARKVLNLAPEWVLAEHGGAFGFDREDFTRRVRWANEAAAAADELSPSGDHRADWDPQRVHVEPLLQSTRRDGFLNCRIVAENHSKIEESLGITLDGRGIVADLKATLRVPAGATAARDITLTVQSDASLGRHVLPFVVETESREVGADTFCLIEVLE